MSGAPLPRSLERLIEALSRLPGVGPRTAERLAFHILRTPLADARQLVHSRYSSASRSSDSLVAFAISHCAYHSVQITQGLPGTSCSA